MERSFRRYDREDVRPSVHALYRENHARQTVDFVRRQHERWLGLDHARMTVWEALERVDQVVDDSDPDTEMSQLQHALQTAERIRRAGLPDWLVLTGLIHDLGKVLCLFGEPQWAVVGDTFPVGCAFDPRVVLHGYFEANPDRGHPVYGTRFGMYEPHCGLDRVLMSWGHDEYIYRVVGDRLPEPARYVLRYHSFYAAHQEGAYDHLMDERDREMFAWVRRFQPFDLYSKADPPVDPDALRPVYQPLIDRWLPGELAW